MRDATIAYKQIMQKIKELKYLYQIEKTLETDSAVSANASPSIIVKAPNKVREDKLKEN